jgi:hypothetical protein
MNALSDGIGLPKDFSKPPPAIVSGNEWPDFCEWARDGGYDQSYFNRFDSKSLALQEQYRDELREQQAADGAP